MSQHEKRIPKETAEGSQFREQVAATKKRRQTLKNNKALKEQGVGSTIPASRKALDSQEANREQSPDEDYDVTLAEVQAEEARVNALRAKLAARNGLRFKDLCLKDEDVLQAMWERKVDDKGKGKTARKSQVQSMGPARRIVSAPTLPTTQGSSKKRKRSNSPASIQSKGGKKGEKSKTSKVSAEKGGTSPKAGDDEPGSDDEQLTEDEDDEDEDDEEEDGDTDRDTRKSSKQTAKGKAQRGKTSDFTGVIKKMVDHMTTRMCALLVTTGMFCSRTEYNSNLKKTWAGVAAEFGVDARSKKYMLRKEHKQAIRARVNSFRSRIRDKLKPAVPTVYELIGEGWTVDEAKQQVERWFPHAYHTKVGSKKGFGHFQHSYIQKAVFESYYTGQNPIGIAFPKLFDPMPLEAMALVCAIIKWIMLQHETGKFTSGKMTFEKLREYYEETMESLKAFQTGIQADRCTFVQKSLYLHSMEQAGCAVAAEEPQPTDNALSDKDFAEDVLTEEELQLIAGTSAKRGRKHVRANNSGWKRSSPFHQSDTQQTPRNDDHVPAPNASRLSQWSSSPPRQNNDDDPFACPRFSSVSLDREEEEPEESHEATPTPHTRHDESNSTRRLPMPGDDDDTEDSDKAKSNRSGSDTEDEASQELPSKKAKVDAPGGLLGKFVGGSQKPSKNSEGKGVFYEKLIMSQGLRSQKAKPKTNLKIQ